ncbi:hypothetical protein CPB85DRAFT_1439321 [Mucidula mucida]|nr:hypothetical protein CPB85DRAFT_1439321 [Mucidula mucida]
MSTTAACPDKECNEVVDVIVKSSDRKLFGAHSHRLALYSAAFPPHVDAGGDATVDVYEQSDVVELLLRYFHPEHEFPDTMSIHFDLFDRLAEAAEKYTIHSLIEISKLRMRLSVSTQPLEVLQYAVRHDYQTLWEPAAAQSLASCSNRQASAVFGYGRLYSAWTEYRHQFGEVYDSITARLGPDPNQHPGGSRKCKIWDRYGKSPMSLPLRPQCTRLEKEGSMIAPATMQPLEGGGIK